MFQAAHENPVDFIDSAHAAIHDLLDDAVSNGQGLTAARAWAVQTLLRAAEEAESTNEAVPAAPALAA